MSYIDILMSFQTIYSINYGTALVRVHIDRCLDPDLQYNKSNSLYWSEGA
jgi:hypothetical protein